jgi:hypothetical protein
MASDASVSVGFGDKMFPKQGYMPGGAIQNSFGYLSSKGCLFARSTMTLQAETFGAGNTVGCGIMTDSFNQRRLFWTKDGKMVGMIDSRLADGMDFVPTGTVPYQSAFYRRRTKTLPFICLCSWIRGFCDAAVQFWAKWRSIRLRFDPRDYGPCVVQARRMLHE